MDQKTAADGDINADDAAAIEPAFLKTNWTSIFKIRYGVTAFKIETKKKKRTKILAQKKNYVNDSNR